MAKPKLLFGPYGTRLEEIGSQIDHPTLHHPTAVLNGGLEQRAVQRVAEEYLLSGQSGSQVATVNAFGLRNLIHTHDGLRIYREAIKLHHHALIRAIESTHNHVQKVLSVGPAFDCYRPEEAPTSIVEAADFHSVQAFEAKELGVDALWVETVNTIAEGAGAAKAAQAFDVPCVISFVIDKEGNLLSGESFGDAVRIIDELTNKHPLGYSVNCCPIEGLLPAVRQAQKAVGKGEQRIFALYPNASSVPPHLFDQSQGIRGIVDPYGFASHLSAVAKEAGAVVQGGCCGVKTKELLLIGAATQREIFSLELPLTDVSIQGHCCKEYHC